MVTGSSGLIGSALCAYLSTGGHRVIRLVRRAGRSPDERTWDPEAPDPRSLDDVDAVVHLAGASIAGRFTDSHKELVRRSRIEPTRRLAETMAAMTDGPRVLVTASAVGYYGSDRGDEELTEDSAPGGLPGRARRGLGGGDGPGRRRRGAGGPGADRHRPVARPAGCCSCSAPSSRPASAVRSAGGRSGCRGSASTTCSTSSARCVVDPELRGPVNVVAPFPVPNRTYTATLARVLRRPARLSVPSFAPGVLLGEQGAREFVLAGQRAVPERLLEVGHSFRHRTLEACLAPSPRAGRSRTESWTDLEMRIRPDDP